MKRFRRSTKSTDKSDPTRQHHISIPQKDAIAILPPKKVIRARYDYQTKESNQGYLGFSQGDFLHVIGRENDPDWYEACNPLQGTRGLVPVTFFEVMDKQVRGSAGYEPTGRASSGGGHDSGYAERAERMSVNGPMTNGHEPRLSTGAGKGPGATVYGVVQYDFQAERPDELQAKAGEAIIVIAQSNPEWFVAKPINRLGGPGLIPVSFVLIHDMTTGKPVTDAQEAVARAAIPKVEEWKKMVADYKNGSIPLGRLDTQQRMERFSIGSSGRPSQDTRRGPSGRPSHEGKGSAQLRYSQLLSPTRAKVPSYGHSENMYWFVVEAFMEDGKSWELQRDYIAFYGLQLALLEMFPEAAGKVEGRQRTLPYMPGPVPWVTENLTSERRGYLDTYIQELLKLDPRIANSVPVKTFFAPTARDREVEPDSEAEDSRLADGSHPFGTLVAGSRASSTGAPSDSTAATVPLSHPSPPRQQSNSPYGQKQPSNHFRNPSDLRVPTPQMLRNNSDGRNGPYNSQSSGLAPVLTNNNHNNTDYSGAASLAPVKIKVRFGDAAGSDCVIIRLPALFNYTDLVQKLRDRWSLIPGVDKASIDRNLQFVIEYADEGTGEVSRIRDEEELMRARERNSKLTLRVLPLRQV